MPEQVIDRGDIDKQIAALIFELNVVRLARTDRRDDTGKYLDQIDLGWHYIDSSKAFCPVQKYSEDMNAARRIMSTEAVGVIGNGTGQYLGTYFIPGTEKALMTESQASAPLAICMAALARKRLEEEAERHMPAGGSDESPDG